MANTFWYDVDVNGAGRVREEIKADRHEQAEAIFKSRWGFNPAKPSDGHKFGISMGGHGEIIENDTIDDNTNNNSSSQSNNNSSSSSSSLSLSDMFTLTMVGAVVIGVASLFPSNNNNVAPVNNNEKMEYSQPTNNQIQFSEHHIDESIPEFFNTEYQEEPINDLGQDWDN